MSSSYDKSVKIWNSRTGRCQADLAGHKAPIVLLAASESTLVATGDRGGSVFIWDLASVEMRWRLKKIHTGHLTAIRWLPSTQTAVEQHSFLTGAQDGILRQWDSRSKTNVFKEKVHGSEGTRAAINHILVHPRHSHLLVTSGADQTIKVFDQRTGCAKELATFALTEFPYSAEFYGDSVICSCGDGSLTAIDVVESLQVQGSVDTKGASMRFLHAKEGQLLCGGDDGNLSFYAIH